MLSKRAHENQTESTKNINTQRTTENINNTENDEDEFKRNDFNGKNNEKHSMQPTNFTLFHFSTNLFLFYCIGH